MSVKIYTTQSMKGPTLRINLFSTSTRNESDISEVFQIDELVTVRFKVASQAYINGDRFHKIAVSAMVHELADEATATVNVFCDELKFSDEWICSRKWTDWIDMGQTKCAKQIFNFGHNYEFYTSSMIETIFRVYNNKTTTSSSLKCYEDSDFTDFTLSTSDGSVDMHRVVLAAHSPVFKTMLTGTWKETKENRIEIKGYTRQTLQNLKDFMYLGTLPDEGLRSLITLAALYSISDLKKECARKLAETVLPEDLYSLHEFACENNIPELSCAITQMTLEKVVDLGHQIKKKKDRNQIKKTDDGKQTEDQ